MQSDSLRIDKWLWTVRIFKTRSQATVACRAGKVSIGGINVKPSREVKPDEIINIRLRAFTRIVRVKGILSNRVSAKLAVEYMEDITPQEEIEKKHMMKELNYEYRHRGLGRPTKKHRRLIERLKKHKHF